MPNTCRNARNPCSNKASNVGLEIIVMDDCSTDNSLAVHKGILPTEPAHFLFAGQQAKPRRAQ